MSAAPLARFRRRHELGARLPSREPADTASPRTHAGYPLPYRTALPHCPTALPCLLACSKNNPEVLERRQRAAADLDSRVQHFIAHNPGRVPQWSAQQLMQAGRGWEAGEAGMGRLLPC